MKRVNKMEIKKKIKIKNYQNLLNTIPRSTNIIGFTWQKMDPTKILIFNKRRPSLPIEVAAFIHNLT